MFPQGAPDQAGNAPTSERSEHESGAHTLILLTERTRKWKRRRPFSACCFASTALAQWATQLGEDGPGVVLSSDRLPLAPWARWPICSGDLASDGWRFHKPFTSGPHSRGRNFPTFCPTTTYVGHTWPRVDQTRTRTKLPAVGHARPDVALMLRKRVGGEARVAHKRPRPVGSGGRPKRATRWPPRRRRPWLRP